MKSLYMKILYMMLSILVIITIMYMTVCVYSISITSKYSDKIYPNTYINNYNISNLNEEKLSSYIESISDEVEQSKIIVEVNGNEFQYELRELGIGLDKEHLKNKITEYDDNLGNVEKIKKTITKTKTIFSVSLNYSEDLLDTFLKELKNKVDVIKTQGKLVMGKDRKLTYKEGTISFELDIEGSKNIIINSIDTILDNNKLALRGTSVKPEYDELSTINTKISTYSTKFDNKVSRGKNIANAAKSLDGVILQPGEIFSFYKYAGSYSKKGYVYYDGVMGNGVCQVASTIYNVQLLAGLKTVERYSHERQMVYVEGGLDATVSERAGKSRLDFKFKNTLSYPIYISAYTKGGTLTIEFWSNDKALSGKTYKTQSQKIGYKGYKTYLLTYKDGKQISKDYIATTWYPK